MRSKSIIISALFVLLFQNYIFSQLIIVNEPIAQNLAQKLVGDGVTISNITFNGNPLMAGYFYNNGGTQLGMDSGIVMTSGRAKSNPGIGVDGPSTSLANTTWGLGGDGDLGAATGIANLRDACVLEFDFTPLGDSIQFKYVFSSEEYVPAFVCTFNDAFAFFISGPGITGLKNIALVPGTNIPVSIFNVNNVQNAAGNFPCPNNTAYYRDNRSSNFFTHQGHTVELTAAEKVIPCQTYHLKLVIADAGDTQYDSGVFLGAKSLTSNAISLSNQVSVDPRTGANYLAEGCTSGSIKIRRPTNDPVSLNVNLTYGGSAINGVDVVTLPTSVIIPANDSMVVIPVIPIADGITEGVELLKVFATSACSTGLPLDSLVFQLRDFDVLPIIPDSSVICRNGSIQLTAPAGYTTYQWTSSAPAIINSNNIRDPLITPQTSFTVLTALATQGTCIAMDSAKIAWKTLELISKTDVFCQNATNGQINVSGGSEWSQPVSFSLDGVNWQTDSSFNNLTSGTYWVKIRDSNCIDSLQVTIAQAFPNLQVINVITSPASCSGNADGTVQFSGTGGNGVYTYALNGGSWQSSSNYNVSAGTHTIVIRDGNGCTASVQVTIPVNNNIQVDAGTNSSICEGENVVINAQSNGTNFSWTPALGLNNASILNPTASPVTTTWYYLTASEGVCNKTDSVLITIRPAPVPDAGPDRSVCVGKVIQLQGSGGVTYQWSPSTYFVSSTTDQFPNVRATENISYSLHVTDAFNCKSLVADVMNLKVTPAVKLFAGNDTLAAINQPIQLNVIDRNLSGVTNYTWTPSSFLSDATIANPVATLQSDQRFLVTGTTPEGCQGTDDILIKVYKGPEIYVPSGFTPNKDGKNDLLKPIGAGIKSFGYFRVYNRSGYLVYSAASNIGWDGTINGIPQPAGVYVWMVQGTDYKDNQLFRKGVVTLIR